MRRASRAWPSEEGADPRILGFIDRLCEPLERTLSREQMADYRLQTLAHLEMMVAELRDFDGITAGESVERALREYGQPDLLAIGYLDEHSKGSRPVGFVRGARSATLWSFVWFGLASAISLLLTQAASILPGLSWAMPYAVGAGWILPVVAGVLCGITVPTGNLLSVCVALAVLLVHTTLVAFVMSPSGEGASFGMLQALAWPPLGCASTYLTALLRRRPRFRSNNRLIA